MEIVGTDGNFQPEEINNQLRSIIVTAFSDTLGEMTMPMIDLLAQYKEMGEDIAKEMTGELSQYGLELTKFLISNINLPPELEKILDQRIGMGMMKGQMGAFTQYQNANAMGRSARPGAVFRGSALVPAWRWGGPSPAPRSVLRRQLLQQRLPRRAEDDLVARLGKLKSLMDAGLINQEEFDAKKAGIGSIWYLSTRRGRSRTSASGLVTFSGRKIDPCWYRMTLASSNSTKRLEKVTEDRISGTA